MTCIKLYENNYEVIREKSAEMVVACFNVLPQNLSEETGTIKPHTDNGWLPGRDSKPAPHDYEAGVVNHTTFPM
jgi:hypothetical protein